MRLSQIGSLGAVVALLLSCNENTNPNLPNNPLPLGASCAPADTIRLAVNDGMTIDCSAGTVITVEGNGAVYLVVPQFAAGGIGSVPYDSTTFTLDVKGATTPVFSTSRVRTAPRPATQQVRMDRFLRARGGRVAAGARRLGTMRRPAATAAAIPAVGSARDFHVPTDSTGTTYQTITATLKYVGQNVLVYIDNGAPSPGFTDTDLTGFGKLADLTLYPIDVATFGPPTDVDQNGHVIMLLSPAVNHLTSLLSCQAQGFVTGYFDGTDFTADANSNSGEIFYGVVPDPSGTISCAHTVADVVSLVPSVFLHEFQHMINFGQHVLVHQGDEEEGWLDEALSKIAEEEGSRYYEAKFPPPTGRTSSTQLFPDSAEAFIGSLLVDSYDYLSFPDTVSLTLHSDSDNGLAWRAGDWLLLRYVGDQKGEGVFQTLVQSALTGAANLSAAMGESFQAVLGNFATAAFTDSIPGVARSSIPARYRFVSRNLRELYNAVYNALGPVGGIPTPFPIFVAGFTPNGGQAAAMVPGTQSYFGLSTDATAKGVAIQFGTTAGAHFDAALHPQVNLYRIQ
jgi:hypothetical protein